MSSSASEKPSNPYPVLVLPETVLFPRVSLPLLLFEERELALVEDLVGPGGLDRAVARPRLVISLCQWDSSYPQEARPNPIGTLAEITEAGPDGLERNIVVRGIERVQISEVMRSEPYLLAKVEPADSGAWSRPAGGLTLRQSLDELRRKAQAVAFGREGPRAQELLNVIEWIDDPGALSDYVAHQLVNDWYLKQELLEMADPAERVRTLLEVIEGGGGGAPNATA